jgi:hypothetical protein
MRNASRLAWSRLLGTNIGTPDLDDPLLSPSCPHENLDLPIFLHPVEPIGLIGPKHFSFKSDRQSS